MSEGGKEHFIQTLHVHDAYAVKDLDIPIGTSADPRHLLLTGPNGSGKSTILSRFAMNCVRSWNELVPFGDRWPDEVAEETRAEVSSRIGVSSSPLVRANDKRDILYYANPQRQPQFLGTKGPRPLNAHPHQVGGGNGSSLLQFLVNIRTEAALAREDGDEVGANELTARLREFETSLRFILDDPKLELKFERSKWLYTLLLGDGREVAFPHLPDGFTSVLHLWSALLVGGEALRQHGVANPPGWAFVDEPETHLHASLQERILPFLSELFPRVQFIVATHSPAVLASLRGATVFDLKTQEAYPSEELRGVRYGTILTEHFGISSDFDLETTRALEGLYKLYDSKPPPGTEDFKRMRQIADSLGEVPHVLVSTVRKLTSRASDSDD